MRDQGLGQCAGDCGIPGAHDDALIDELLNDGDLDAADLVMRAAYAEDIESVLTDPTNDEPEATR